MKSGEKNGATRIVGLIQAQALAVKTNSLRGLLGRFHQLADRLEQDNDFLIMSFNSRLQFGQF